MIGALLGDFLPYIISALIGIGALIGVYAGGRKAGADKTKRKAAEDYIKTRKRIDEVSSPADDAAADEWLRDRAKRGRDL